MNLNRLRALVLGGLAAVALTVVDAPGAAAADGPYDVLVFSKTTGWRHDSIPNGIQAFRELGAANNFTVTATEDARVFTDGTLGRYEAVVFLNTTSESLGGGPLLDAAPGPGRVRRGGR